MMVEEEEVANHNRRALIELTDENFEKAIAQG